MNSIVVDIQSELGGSLKPSLLEACPNSDAYSCHLSSDPPLLQLVQKALCDILKGQLDQFHSMETCALFAPLFEDKLIQKIINAPLPLKLGGYDASELISKMVTKVDSMVYQSNINSETVLRCAVKQDAWEDARGLVHVIGNNEIYVPSDMKTLLWMGVREKNLSSLAQTLKIAKEKEFPISRNVLSHTLVEAVQNNFPEGVDLLLTTDAEVDESLVCAIELSRLDLVQKILRVYSYRNISRYAIDNRGNTALMLAVLKEDIHLVELILNSSAIASMYMENNEGNTALTLSIHHNQPEIFSLLLKASSKSRLDKDKIEALINGSHFIRFRNIWHAFSH